MADGRVLYEIDVEADDEADQVVSAGFGTTTGEFNVYVDAETRRIAGVDIEYWEIGPSGEGEKGGAENYVFASVFAEPVFRRYDMARPACDVSSCRRAGVLKHGGGLRPQCPTLFAV